MSDVVEDADVRMIQTGDGFCFTLEPLFHFRAISKMRRQNFDGDNAVKASIAGAVYLAHSTRTDGGEDFVRP